ncbi:hypothetical protein [Paludisphaera mucosa]|uniref:Uncharacterized protein n=1 Tax=Paludisphaera mucosa TaxID=3030827 RepID=A0ABT6FE06_9BACT|nr:hypothetical protein [Paludisphaera mucosa]MDG3005811.1 hypothetical protein [Paludisphaera mucosa]
MSRLAGRIAVVDGLPTLTACGLPVAEVLRLLEAGEEPAAVVGCHPLDLVAAVFHARLGDDGSLGPKLVQSEPDRPGLIAAVTEPALSGVLPRAPRPARLALAAGLLQVLDAWEASHEAAQESDDLGERAFSAYWHGVAHRREPDAGNAAYWFRRVGRHSLFPALAEAARPLLDASGDPTAKARLLGADGWDPSAMIDLCTRARPGTDQETLARRLQRLEMALLLGATADAVVA